jgi:TfoX/Sxy family transcriptional regulator of competence genes
VAYDEDLAARLRDLVAEAGEEVTERKMFGGLAFMVAGNMAVAAGGKGAIMVRVDPAQVDELLAATPATRMEMGGRTMKGWVEVAAEHLTTDESLGRWARLGTARALALRDGIRPDGDL